VEALATTSAWDPIQLLLAADTATVTATTTTTVDDASVSA
jgi:hypothetical protein